MKYVVNLNGKAYEVEVEETQAVIMNVTDAPVAAAPAASFASGSMGDFESIEDDDDSLPF